MSPDLLHVVTAVANPLRWQSRIRLYRQFERHMLDSGVRLTTVECAYGDRPHELGYTPGVNYVPVGASTMVWNKESLLAAGIARLPRDWKYVAWIDADVFFRRPTWAADTVHALQLHAIVQPWSDCYDLGPNDEHLLAHRSFCRQWQDGKPVGPGPYTFAHPGYAWATRRDVLANLGGLLETAALGAADHHMALSLVGKANLSLPGNIPPAYAAPIYRWQDRATRHVSGNIGYVPGTIEHGWHGTKASRKYIERWGILVKHKFDPAVDLKRNEWGILELAGNKPEMARDMAAYFRQRNEDSNDMGAA